MSKSGKEFLCFVIVIFYYFDDSDYENNGYGRCGRDRGCPGSFEPYNCCRPGPIGPRGCGPIGPVGPTGAAGLDGLDATELDMLGWSRR